MWIKFHVSPPHRVEVLKLLRPLVNPTRYVTGCTDAYLSEKTDDGHILFSTEWRSRKQMDHHIRSEAFGNVLLALDLCNTRPILKIYKACETDGIEYITAVRGIDHQAQIEVN
jgi:quinol monooxygenase YgiN